IGPRREPARPILVHSRDVCAPDTSDWPKRKPTRPQVPERRLRNNEKARYRIARRPACAERTSPRSGPQPSRQAPPTSPPPHARAVPAPGVEELEGDPGSGDPVAASGGQLHHL